MAYAIYFLLAILIASATACRRVPNQDIAANRIKSSGDNEFRIAISGDPTEYVAGKAYNRESGDILRL